MMVPLSSDTDREIYTKSTTYSGWNFPPWYVSLISRLKIHNGPWSRSSSHME